MASVAQNVYFARLAEQGERFEDMITYMKAVVEVKHLIYAGEPYAFLRRA